MERNQVIGMTLIAALLLAYFWLSPSTPKPPTNTQTQTKTEIQHSDTVKHQVSTLDSATLLKQFGDFSQFATGEGKDVVLENKDVKITFNTFGGKVKTVLLKNFKTYSKEPLVLIDEAQSSITSLLPTSSGNIDISQLYYSQTLSQKGDTSVLTFRLQKSDTQYFEQVYSLSNKEGYEVGYKINAVGLNSILKKEPLQFFWKTDLKNTEKDVISVRTVSTVNYYTEADGFDDMGAKNSLQERSLENPAKWVAFKQKFFLAGFIADNGSLSKVSIKTEADETDKTIVKTMSADWQLPINDITSGKSKYRFYFGPNDFQIVKNVTDGFGKNVYLGYPVINIISRFIIVPIFKLLEFVFSNYGILIIALVILVKLLLFPLNYRSYISMAKTRVLAPELAVLKEQFPNDLQKQQQEQMKLYQQVGVNPLSGCIPVLLQMPILLALFSLFPNLIELRQKTFLWSEDLSTYDSIINLPFVVPFGYGNHVSLFTILMTMSTLAYTYFNNQMTPNTMQQGPVNMKIVSYTTPVIFMFVLNSFPAGLSFYYFVSNIVSIGQQLIIRRFVDEDKIHQSLQANKEKNKDKKKSKFQQRLDDAMRAAEAQKKLAEETKKKK